MAASNKPNSDVAYELHGNKRSKLSVDEKLATPPKSKPTALNHKPGSTDLKRSIFTAVPRNFKGNGGGGNTTTSTGTQFEETKDDVEKEHKATETYTATTTETSTITAQDLEITPSTTAEDPSPPPTTTTETIANTTTTTLPTNQTSAEPNSPPSQAIKKKKPKVPNKPLKTGKTHVTPSRSSSLSHTAFSNSSSHHSLSRNNFNKAKLNKIKETIPNSKTKLTYFNNYASSYKPKELEARKPSQTRAFSNSSPSNKEANRITSRTGFTSNNNKKKNNKNRRSSRYITKVESGTAVPSAIIAATSKVQQKDKITEEQPLGLEEIKEIDAACAETEITTRRRARPYSLIPVRSRSVGSTASFAQIYAKIRALLSIPMEEENNNNNNNTNNSTPDSGTNSNNNNNNSENNNNNDSNANATAATNDKDNDPSTSRTSRKRKINEENTAKTNEAAATASAAAAGPSTSTRATEEDDKDKEEDKDAKKKKNRCAECRKKVGLTGFECRCGGLYCAVHRYSDKHDCTFNYREHGAQEIRRNNPVVVGEKIQKI